MPQQWDMQLIGSFSSAGWQGTDREILRLENLAQEVFIRVDRPEMGDLR
jgi:hypothetical protein